jgi:uncharacterized membrane-anchored protein YhcB (DUF1043 family)
MKLLLIGLLVGFGVGALLLYLIQQGDLERLDEAEAELKKMRRALADAEAEHEERLKDAIAALQQDYQQKNDQQLAKVEESYQQQIQSNATIEDKIVEASPVVIHHEMTTDEELINEESVIVHGFSGTPVEASVTEKTTDILISEEESLALHEVSSSPPTESVENAAPKSIVREEPSAIHEIASTPETATDSLNLVDLGQPGATENIPQLSQASYDTHASTRVDVATALGNIAQDSPVTEAIAQMIPTLTRLSQDSAVEVRKAAVIALGKIRSSDVIVLLEMRLQDSDSEVVQLSSFAIQNYKNYPAATTSVEPETEDS